MLNPLLGRSRRHLVAFIHPSSLLSQHPALSLGSGHALSPPPHAREQHHHYRKWQLAGGDGRTGDAPSGLRSISHHPAAKRRWLAASVALPQLKERHVLFAPSQSVIWLRFYAPNTVMYRRGGIGIWDSVGKICGASRSISVVLVYNSLPRIWSVRLCRVSDVAPTLPVFGY